MFLLFNLAWLFNCIKPIMLYGGSGGGSTGGVVGYPVWMENTHRNWLIGETHSQDVINNSMVDLINVAHGVGGNPYEGELAFDPDAAFTPVATSPLGKMNAQFVASKTILDAIDPATDWGTYITAAAGKFTSFSTINFLSSLDTAISGLLASVESALSSTSITAMVTAFETNKKTRFLRDTGIWSAGMADINAVHTSSFIMGLAIQQIEFSNSVDQFERELKSSLYNTIVQTGIDGHIKAEVLRVNNEDGLLMKGPEIMANLAQLKDQMQGSLMQVKAEIERLNIVALKEQNDRQMELEVDEATWDFEVYMYGANLLGSIAGASSGRKQQMSKGQTALGGAMAGASIGAAFGPIGAGVGFVAGAVLGWAFG